MDLKQAQAWLNTFFNSIEEHKAYLSELDNPIGDGDHGFNMARGCTAAKAALEATPPTDLNGLFKSVGMSLLSKVGGAAGPLYGSVFLAFAKASLERNPSDDYGAFLRTGLEAIVLRGKATVGEKTMVDVWHPFIEQFPHSASVTVIDALVEATKPLKATKGRAAYLGDRSIGHTDPGSFSSGLLFKAFIRSVSL
jgi:dihydroxyacetone kinase-like protein